MQNGNTGGRGETIFCAILIAKYREGKGSVKCQESYCVVNNSRMNKRISCKRFGVIRISTCLSPVCRAVERAHFDRIHMGQLQMVPRDLGLTPWDGLVARRIYIRIHTLTHLSIHPSIHLSIHPSTYLSIHPSIYLSIFISIYLSVSIYQSIYIYLFEIYLST